MCAKLWTCSDCKNSDKQICKHLNEELPRESGSSVRPVFTKHPLTIETRSKSKDRELFFRARLHRFSLEQIRIDILTLKFVYGWTYQEIAEQLGIPNKERPSKSRVYKIYQESLDMLKKRGFNL